MEEADGGWSDGVVRANVLKGRVEVDRAILGIAYEG